MAQENPPPIIIKKIQADEMHRHGGAWKIALADMMTAMMAFFLVLWLISSTSSDDLTAIADYFKPQDKILGSEGEVASAQKLARASFESKLDLGSMELVSKEFENAAVSAEKDKEVDVKEIQNKTDERNFNELERELKRLIGQDASLSSALDQINFVREEDGLRIEIVDRENASMFAMGTSALLPRAREIMEKVAVAIGHLPNRIMVRGHTDSHGYKTADGRNNWILSAERSDSTRLVLEAYGVKSYRFVKIEGVADTLPFIANDIYDPRNRRINIVLRYQSR